MKLGQHEHEILYLITFLFKLACEIYGRVRSDRQGKMGKILYRQHFVVGKNVDSPHQTFSDLPLI